MGILRKTKETITEHTWAEKKTWRLNQRFETEKNRVFDVDLDLGFGFRFGFWVFWILRVWIRVYPHPKIRKLKIQMWLLIGMIYWKWWLKQRTWIFTKQGWMIGGKVAAKAFISKVLLVSADSFFHNSLLLLLLLYK